MNINALRADKRHGYARALANGLLVKFFAFAWFSAAAPASACPICDTETGVAVRAGIVEDFPVHFLATIAPFPVLIAAVALLHHGFPSSRRFRS
jgi:hypothetical protein